MQENKVENPQVEYAPKISIKGAIYKLRQVNFDILWPPPPFLHALSQRSTDPPPPMESQTGTMYEKISKITENTRNIYKGCGKTG